MFVLFSCVYSPKSEFEHLNPYGSGIVFQERKSFHGVFLTVSHEFVVNVYLVE